MVYANIQRLEQLSDQQRFGAAASLIADDPSMTVRLGAADLPGLDPGEPIRHPLRVVVDSQNYRSRRERSLVRMAEAAAEEVRRTRSSRLLEAMNPFERRLVHTALSQLEDIQMERGSIAIPFWTSVFYIAHKKVQNVAAHPTNYDILDEAWIDESA